MQVLGVIAYFALGIVQFLATLAGLKAWLGISTFFAILLSFVTSWIPLLGTVLGFFGATNVWGWAWWQAGLLFFGGMVAVFALGGLAGVAAWFGRRRA